MDIGDCAHTTVRFQVVERGTFEVVVIAGDRRSPNIIKGSAKYRNGSGRWCGSRNPLGASDFESSRTIDRASSRQFVSLRGECEDVVNCDTVAPCEECCW